MNHIVTGVGHFQRDRGLWVSVLLVVVLLLPTSAEAAKKQRQIPLPEGTLTAVELFELFKDKTVLSQTVQKKRESLTYYAPNGEVRQTRDGQRRSGVWRVKANGRICLKMESSREKCRIVVRGEDGTLTKYIVKKNGKHVPTVRYKRIWVGNPNNL